MGTDFGSKLIVSTENSFLETEICLRVYTVGLKYAN